MKPATKVALSRRFGDFLNSKIGSTATREARQANRGVVLVIAGVMLTYTGYQIERFEEVLNHCDQVFVEDSDEQNDGCGSQKWK